MWKSGVSRVNINWRPRDEELSGFVETYVDSFASWDLILFMHFNPTAMDTADAFASRLGRPVEEVSASLDRFCKLGCVSMSRRNAARVYSSDLRPDVKASFAKFARAQDDRELRLMLIRSILAKNRE